MSGIQKPDRVGSRFVKNFEGRGMGSPKQGVKPTRRGAANGIKSTLTQPNNTAEPGKVQSQSIARAGYKRTHAGVSPTGLPLKRQPEGSVLTPGSTKSGAPQPFNNNKKS